MNAILVTAALVVIAVLAFVAWWLQRKSTALQQAQTELDSKLRVAQDEIRTLRTRYGPVVDLDAEVAKVQDKLTRLRQEYNDTAATAERKQRELAQQYDAARNTYESLKRDVSLLQENIEDISYGLYKPHFSFQTSDEFRQQMEEVREKQGRMIREGRAATCSTTWAVGGDRKEGERMAKQNMKLFLRAFNGECDAAIANVAWNNITKMEERMKKSFDAINHLGTVLQVSITEEYLQLKLEELRLTHEFEEKKEQEREEQRRIRAQIREEEKAQREIDKARREAEEDEERYDKALAKARAEAEAATGAKLDKLSEQIRSLEVSLSDAHSKKERAISRAELTKSGFVYVISNIGSFGERVLKIGMTRRLEPMERIEELGDASVPFPFDVHAMLYSDNAPKLEAEIHDFLETKRVNLVNARKEFFESVELADLEKFAKERGLTVQFTMLAEAKEYRETLALRASQRAQADVAPESAKAVEKYPSSLFGSASTVN